MTNTIQKLFLPFHRAAHWPDGPTYQHEQRRWMLTRVLSEVPLDGVQTAVELGCGDGWVCGELAHQLGCRVVGFDINLNRIAPAANAITVLLVGGDASAPPIAHGSVDLVFTFAVLEHLPDRLEVLLKLKTLLKPGGKMIHIVPTSTMKILQWVGHGPDLVRKQVRGVTRFLADQRHHRSQKYIQGHETNNPRRASRRRGLRKLIPRVHGEYENNFREFVENSHQHWTELYGRAGLRVVRAVPLGLFSPYFFGFSGPAKWAARVGLASLYGYVVEMADECNRG